MKTSILVVMLVLLVLLSAFAGCSKKEADTTTTTTTTSPTTTTAAPPAKDPTNVPLDVEYDHCGLHFKLDSTYTVGLSEENKNILTFSNEQYSGTVVFGTLSELGNGATTSKQYADIMVSQCGDEKAWVGTSTGFGYYYVYTTENAQVAQCLYIHGENAWVVTAQSNKIDAEAAKTVAQIVGRSGLVAEEIPA